VAAVPPSSERRRPRPGSLERPVNGRLYRGTWLLVGLPLLLLAFSVARPAPLQPPNLPPAFDRDAAAQLARDLSTEWPNRVPGTAGATGAAEWFRQQLAPYGFIVRSEPFTATIPGRGRVRFTNLVAVKPGASRRTIVVMAHRDNTGVGVGANDNASGTAALIELARAYAPQAGAARLQLPYSLLFLSTDGGTDGGIGAAQFAAHSLEAPNVAAVLNLDAVAGRGEPRLEFGGDTARSPEPGLVETARSVLTRETGVQPGWPGALRQLIDLGFPFSLYEQAPFVSRGVPAVTITTSPDRPPSGAGDTVASLNVRRLEQVGRAVQNALDAMEQGVALSSGPSSYVYLGQRIVRGWAIEIVLIAMLLPYLAAAIDLFARCRRRRIRVAPAFRSYRSRLWFWIWCGLLVALFGLFGAWTSGTGRPPPLDDVSWPTDALIALAVLMGISWFVARERLLPRRRVRPEEELAGHVAALLALGVVGLLVVATNPFALLFLLPSLHAWLWLPQVRARALPARVGVLLIGFAGPALLIWSFAGRYGLGFDAPWYIASLFSVGYAPIVLLVIGLGWLAGAGQLVALTAGRYAPYPSEAERGPRGPIRATIRRMVLAQRKRRRIAELDRETASG
jgi:Peptidase family M28